MTLYFDYSKFTLEEIDTYFNTDFECDGDKKEIGLQEDAGKSNRRTWFCRVSLNGER